MTETIKPRKTIEDRFFEKTTEAGDCLIWTGSLTHNGYGQLRAEGRMIRAHRWIWEQAHGPIPAGMVVDHLEHCDRACVEVDHLRLATATENKRHRAGANPGRTHDLPRNVYRNGNRYQVQVTVNRRQINGGSFPTVERATVAAKHLRAFWFRPEFAGRA